MVVGLICTSALVLWQDICQERLGGGGWKRGEGRGGSCSGSPIASGPSWVSQVHGAFLISLHSGASRHGTTMCPGDTPLPPYCTSLLSLLQSFPCLSPIPLSLSFAQPFSPLTPPPPLLSFPGASLPSRVGQKGRRRALLSRHSHLTQCGTTWLITNPISGALCASKGCSVLLSHFIRAITGHFIFCLQPNVLSDTLNTSGAVRGDSRGS